MGDKSARKKQYIIDKAREVFMDKGYKTVTMKDIVEICEISRGGLYLYFDSTRQLFMEVLKADVDKKEDLFSGQITDDTTATELLVMFLLEQKMQIHKKKDSLVKATYEFYFEGRPEKKEDILRQNFETNVKVLEKIIAVGVEAGEFECGDAYETAKNIMYTVEGLKITAQTMGISSDALDKQILYILSTLGVENDAE